MATKLPTKVYQLKITLRGSKPPIWRRILVPDNIGLDVLHMTLQIVMGWENSHLHQFIIGRMFYGMVDDEFDLGGDLDVQDETQYKLADLLHQVKDAMIYEYDFGDSWEHAVVLEKILPYDKTMTLPACIKGKRACPPEDCGGVWGYENLLEVLQDPAHPEHDEMLEWLDVDESDEFDPEEFDMNEVNRFLVEYIK